MTRQADVAGTADRAAWWYVWANVAVLAAGTAWCVAYFAAGIGTEALAYAFVPAGGALATAAIQHMSPSTDLDPVSRRFWRAMLLAIGLVTISYVWLSVDMLTHAAQAHTRSMPLPAAAGAAIGIAIAIWGVARVPVAPVHAVDRWRMLLDRTIGFLGCAAVLWYAGLAPMLSARQPWSRQAMVLTGLAFLVALGAATKVSYVAGGPVDRAAIRLVAASGASPPRPWPCWRHGSGTPRAFPPRRS